MTDIYKEYGWRDANATHMHAHYMPHLFELAGGLAGARVLDVGCGNGFICGEFLKRGYRAVGIDLSEQGIEIARRSYPQGRFELLPANERILSALGEPPFDLVVSTEVIEHIYDPRSYAR